MQTFESCSACLDVKIIPTTVTVYLRVASIPRRDADDSARLSFAPRVEAADNYVGRAASATLSLRC
jgi:hypothetical protein